MSDRKIRICFLHPWIKTIDDVLRLLCIKDMPLAERFELDEISPDYVIATDYVITKPEYVNKFRNLVWHNRNGCDPVRIFWTEEAVSPDFNIFDYAVCWNWKLNYRDRVSRIPPHIFIGDNMTEKTNTLTFGDARKLLLNKAGFCSFVCSNPRAHPKRDELFYAISGYKHVVSPGSHLNNTGKIITNDNKASEVIDGLGRGAQITWQDVSIRIKSRYKFSIAAENACSDGYTSEKLFTSFLAHTVPIYWGNPYVAEEYNPEAFVNCNDYDSFDSVVKRVREIDENDDLWAHIVSQPWQTEEQQKRSEAEYNHYKKFITNIFSQPLDKARRRSEGTWSKNYELWFFKRVLIRKKTPFLLRLVRFIFNTDKILNPTWWRIKINTLTGRMISIEDMIKEKKI